MRLSTNRKDLTFLMILIMLFMVIAQEGIIKYGILSAAIFVCLGARKKISLSKFIIIYHTLVYVVIGLLLSIISKNISFDSIKQLLIYLCSGLFSISFFSMYGKNRSTKLVDIQFTALCISYLILYARYFTLSTFYYESNIFAYIFGVYGLIYFCQKRYVMMLFAVVFMLFDHKRIVDAAFVFALLSILSIKFVKKTKYRKLLIRLASLLLLFVPMGWIFLCSNGKLAMIFASLGINTMGRLEGTGAWTIAAKYYEYSPAYFGKGIGWVLNWLKNASIFGFNNLHNDFLASYIELGFIFYFIWLLAFLYCSYWEMKRDLKIANLLIVLIGFMFINFLTDNIYIYVTFLCPFYIVLLSVLFGNDNEKYKINI